MDASHCRSLGVRAPLLQLPPRVSQQVGKPALLGKHNVLGEKMQMASPWPRKVDSIIDTSSSLFDLTRRGRAKVARIEMNFIVVGDWDWCCCWCFDCYFMTAMMDHNIISSWTMDNGAWTKIQKGDDRQRNKTCLPSRLKTNKESFWTQRKKAWTVCLSQ
jgi:hypothetical protein